MSGRPTPFFSRAFAALAVCASAAAVSGLLTGCTNAPAGTKVVDEETADLPPKVRHMRVVSAYGGTHRRTEVREGVWYQAYSNHLLFLDAQSGTTLSDLELAPRGTTGFVSDFVLLDDAAFVVLFDDFVVEVDVSNQRDPRVVRRWGRRELGIAPRTASIVEAGGRREVYISGEGGAVRLADAESEGTTLDDDGKPIPPTPPETFLAGRLVGSVVGAEGGPVACVGRRILRLADGAYLGAASRLAHAPRETGAAYLFILQATEGAQVGLMGADFREISASALKGEVHTVRVLDDRFIAVNDFEVATWKFAPNPGADATVAADGGTVPPGALVLGELLSVPVKGARDIGKVKRNRFVVGGTFGRALYRYLPEGDKPGDTFYSVERLPGRLEVSVTDRRRILAASREGKWMYLIGEEAELTDRDIVSPDRPSFRVDANWGVAIVNEARDEVSIRVGERSESYRPIRGGRIATTALADGRIWIGHDHGIDILGFDPLTKEVVAEDRLYLEGPVFAIYPNRVGGGVSYVAQFGGFGVVRPLDEDAAPVLAPGATDGVPDEREKAKSDRKPADES
jgi:hypothetical protein